MRYRKIILSALESMKTLMEEEGKKGLEEQRRVENENEEGVITDLQAKQIWGDFDELYGISQDLVNALLLHYQHKMDEEDIEAVKVKIGELFAASPSSAYVANLLMKIPQKFRW